MDNWRRPECTAPVHASCILAHGSYSCLLVLVLVTANIRLSEERGEDCWINRRIMLHYVSSSFDGQIASARKKNNGIFRPKSKYSIYSHDDIKSYLRTISTSRP